jgi:flagellin
MQITDAWAGNLGPTIISDAYSGVSNSTIAIASGLNLESHTASSIIAGQLRGEVAVNRQGVRNANDAISLLQTFDGAAGGISSNLIRMATLAAQANNGTYSTDQKATMDAEFKELAAEINRVAFNTQFNGNKLLEGEGTAISVSLGAGESIEILSKGLDINASGLDLAADAGGALAIVQEHLQQVSSYRGYLGGQQNVLLTAMEAMEIDIENAMAVESRLSDTDLATATAARAAGRIRAETAIAVQSQANVMHQTAVQLLT